MRIRPSVGLILLDEFRRILLFNVQDSTAIDVLRSDVTSWWGPPGGGVEDGETFEAAGIRELWEETGLRVSHLGSWVWTFERIIQFPDDIVLFHYRYFVVDAPSTSVDFSHLVEEERAIIRGHRWWTIDQIAQSSDVFLPPGLPKLLRPIIVGKIPSRPIVLR